MPARRALERAKATTARTRFLRVKLRMAMHTAASPRKAKISGSDTIIPTPPPPACPRCPQAGNLKGCSVRSGRELKFVIIYHEKSRAAHRNAGAGAYLSGNMPGLFPGIWHDSPFPPGEEWIPLNHPRNHYIPHPLSGYSEKRGEGTCIFI